MKSFDSETSARDTPSAGRCYALYGLRLRSDFPFRSHLVASQGPADLIFTSLPLDRAEREEQGAEGLEPGVYLVGEGEREWLYYPRLFDFLLTPGRIECRWRPPEERSRIERALLGTVLAYWLERRGWLALHAAAVEVEGQGLAFLADNQSGKTTLAISLLQAGYALITDNLLAIEPGGERPLCHAGLPQMRLWPEHGRQLLPELPPGQANEPDTGKWVIPLTAGLGRLAQGPTPLGRIYLPTRSASADRIRILPLSPAEALRELQGKSFTPTLAEAAGHQARRFQTLARLLHQVPVHRLEYGSGIAQLPRVREALLEDLRQAPR